MNVMNLLNYTYKLYNKIKFYDKYFQNNNFESTVNNPFFKAKSQDITIVWVDTNDKLF